LYANDPAYGARGAPGDLAAGYVPYYFDPDHRIAHEWNWIDDFGTGPHYLRMWFKPLATSWFGGYLPERGNTYTYPWRHVNAASPKPTGSDVAGGLPDAGQVLLPPGRQLGLRGPFESPMQWFADIVWAYLCRISDCDWPDWFFFDERGPRVGGLLVWTFDDQKKSARNVTGTKLAAGQMFDVVSPSISFAYDERGFANRYWLFGGYDAADVPTDEMWGARRVIQDGGGPKTYADLEGSPNLPPGSPDGVLAGPGVYFELAKVPRADAWPPARAGAVLLCTGLGTVAGKPCGKICPRVDLALAASGPGGIGTDDPGSLLLIGGEGAGGLLSDIWMYDGPAALNPGGWRLAGWLPGVDGGLAAPGVVQIGRDVWLVGGRTNAGASADVWRVGVDTGLAERVAVAGVAPAARISPAVTYDAGTNRILVFGGTDASGAGISDVWGFDTATRSWLPSAGACSGINCPRATGREALHFDEAMREVTVVVDRSGPDADVVAWTLREGIWRGRIDQMTDPAATDCNQDGVVDPMAEARCGTGSGGFPDFGRMTCLGGELACAAPASPGQIEAEYTAGGVRTVVAEGKDIYVSIGSRVDVYRVVDDGTLEGLRTLRLRRAANDIVLLGELLLAADARGLAVYRKSDGAELSRVDSCGKARRVFPFGDGALVVGLRSLMIVELEDPSVPVVTQDLRIWPSLDGILVTPERRCSRVVEAIERLWDAVSPAGGGGRDVAAFDGGRLFLNLLGSTYVLDFRDGLVPSVSEGLPTGLLSDMRVEGRFLYANAVWGDGIVLAEAEPGSWEEVGSHDVGRWVSGTAGTSRHVIAWGHGRLSIAGRQ
jgi:hypothetical protein